MAASELQLLACSLTSAVAELDEDWDRLFKLDDGSTAWVNAARLLRVRQTIIVIGAFSLLETALQPKSLESFATEISYNDDIIKWAGKLDNRVLVFRKAINVLKHGKGSSYDWLVARSDLLPFRVRQPNEAFLQEGDVSEGWWLIDVDKDFVLELASLIEEIDNICLKIGPFE